LTASPFDPGPRAFVFVFELLALDVHYRLAAGLPALLAGSDLADERLRRAGVAVSADMLVELIGLEYQGRWQRGERPSRQEYLDRFPEHADALQTLRPRWTCPHCGRRDLALEDERAEAARCSDCRRLVSVADLFGPRPGPAGAGGPPSGSPAVEPPQANEGAASGVADTTARTDGDGSAPAPAAAGTAAPPRLGRYELGEEIARGGMGAVFRARDPALNRELAVKVLRPELHRHPDLVRRFLEEAQITAQLPHPGVVPVYDIGRDERGLPFLVMKLVRGRTLKDLLAARATPQEELPRFVAVFEQVCQALAFAHSRRVVHRDLKPDNVMVGRFGEVQVMDWGLARVLPAEGQRPEEPAADGVSVVETLRDRGAGPRTAGALGTWAYMPPEQANEEWERVDARADVFGLGGLLCAILTGQPPFAGGPEQARRQARRADLAGALGRLEQCGADAALVNLCRECLAPEREGRPRNAAIVAERVAAYEAEVQQRLRQAELERVAAQTRAQEEQARALVERERTREALARVAAERRARQRLLSLAAAVLVLLLVSVATAWRMQQEHATTQARQERADREALAALERAGQRLDEGWRLHDLAMLREGVAEGERAADIARAGAGEAVRQQVTYFQTEAAERLGRAEKNLVLLSALLDIATPRETKTYAAAGSGQMMALAEPSVEQQYAAAFRRRWPDLDVDKQAESEVVARLREEPEVVVQGVIAGLDRWMLERRRQKRAEAQWRRLLGLVEQLDPSEPRRQLRALLIGAVPPPAESVASLLAGRPTWPALWELARGHDWRRLRQLRGQMNVADEPVLTVLLLAEASSAVGDRAGAEAVLRQALARWPDEVALLDALGKVLERQGRSRLAEAIGCYRAARAKRPGLGVALGLALGQAGQAAEGEAILRDLVRQEPNNPEMFFSLGYALHGQGKHAEAEAACRKAIELKPDDAEAYVNLGLALHGQGKPVEAEAACRKAIELKPDLEQAYNNLGLALDGRGKRAEAEVAYRKAIALKPDFFEAYNNLGLALHGQGKLVEAEAAYHKFIALKPDFAEAYVNLGNALRGQGRFTESLAAYRRGHELGSKQAGWCYSSLQWVREAERTVELEKTLPAVLQGEASPSNAGDAIALPQMCQQFKKRHVAAARLYAHAFTAEPKISADLNQQHRYNAACSAALAAAGQGEDARLLPDKAVCMFRQWALVWLRADLEAWRKVLDKGKPPERAKALQALRHWQQDADLAGVREEKALAGLPDEERDACRKLWADVAALVQKATPPP
jgi:serine/threonine-protein kinase